MQTNSAVVSTWVDNMSYAMSANMRSAQPWQEALLLVEPTVDLAHEDIRLSLVTDWMFHCLKTSAVFEMVPDSAKAAWLGMIEYRDKRSMLDVRQSLGGMSGHEILLADILHVVDEAIGASEPEEIVERAVCAVVVAFQRSSSALMEKEVNPAQLLRELNSV